MAGARLRLGRTDHRSIYYTRPMWVCCDQEVACDRAAWTDVNTLFTNWFQWTNTGRIVNCKHVLLIHPNC